MKTIPYLQQKNGRTTLMVEDKPFLILGGEIHNSSASDLNYMEQRVWPGLRKIGGNCYLIPVYWECMEPEPGEYDFTLVDGILKQARREGVHLVFLWFGLWKTGGSGYIPAWMKKDPEYFYMKGNDGRLIESVSPFCREAVELDKLAFRALMTHLKEVDEERTVLMMQVENEVGIWWNPRDYSEQAEALFHSEIPAEMAELYDVSGTWEEAFGIKACEYFMAWAFSNAVEQIAFAGKEVYPLPMFTNCMDMGLPLPAGKLPSGQPLPRVHKIWRRFAPSVDLYGPNLYAPAYKEICNEYAAANPLVIPEVGQGKDLPSKALYTAAAYNTLCFSPFGIDVLTVPIGENDLLAQLNTDLPVQYGNTGEMLSLSYRLIHTLWEDIRNAQEKETIFAFLQQGMEEEAFMLDDYTIKVSYGPGASVGPFGQPGHRSESAPCGGGFIIRKDCDTFLICGVSCTVKVEPKYAGQESVFILDKRELLLSEKGLIPGRILNGDERNHLILGSVPSVQEITFYRR